MHISIHALRKESDAVDRDVGRPCSISIHALRKESDLLVPGGIDWTSDISIHALRKESDSIMSMWINGSAYFNPRSP